MNALRRLPSWCSRRARCLMWCAAGWALLAGQGHADEVMTTKPLLAESARLGTERTKRHKIAAPWSAAAAWMNSDLEPLVWRRKATSVPQQAGEGLADDRYLTTAISFDTRNLFRTRKGQKYRETLQLVVPKRQLRVWLRKDLQLQCEVKRYRWLDTRREMGLGLGLYYRFE